VYLSVEDNGPGMTPDQCASLFAPYRRLNFGRRGTGLGLYIVKRLAEAQGGTVSLKSKVGVGSTFSIAFPRADRSTDMRASLLRAKAATTDPSPALAMSVQARA
jgi:two-component system secretion sensor histidine kinase SsrA